MPKLLSTGESKTFGFAFLWTSLTFASLNALSYFVRSGGWGGLLRSDRNGTEAIGFPWLVWREGSALPVEPLGLLGDIVLVIIVGLLVGAVAVRLIRPLATKPISSPPSDRSQTPVPRFQYSLSSLLLLTAAAAVVAGVVRGFSGIGPALLAAAYLFGPAVILAATFCMRWTASKWVKYLISFLVTLLLTTVLFAGAALSDVSDFTKVLLGLFVCWVPQCVLIALTIAAWHFVASSRK